jgi:hemoglobin/transferrin/lactoferrin receptor protein
MKILYAVIFMISVSVVYSQNLTVTDKTTLHPIENAKITGTADLKLTILTDIFGKADISGFSASKEIRIEAEGYHAVTLSLTSLENAKYLVELTERSYTTDEIVVSTSKFGTIKEYMPQKIDILFSNNIEFMNQQNTADVLQNTGQIHVQKSQLGGGSPILRGLEASRVLIMVDGVRLNNAIFRAGHLQNVIRIDENDLAETEIIYGPGSVIYGSDALGGTMNFFTKLPSLSPTKKTLYKANAYGRFSSVNEEKTGHVDFNIGTKNIGFYGSFSFSDFGDLRQGKNTEPYLPNMWDKPFIVERINGRDTALTNDEYLQTPSAYYQYSALAKVLFKQNKNISHIISFRYTNTNDVPRYDRLTEVSGGNPRFAEWYYGPEKWMQGSYQLRMNGMKTFFNDASFTLSYQDLEESRHDRRFQNKFRNDRTEKVKVYSANIDFNKKLKDNELSFGLEAYYNDVKSEAVKVNVDTDSTALQSTRYPVDGSKMMSIAAYLLDNWRVHKMVNITAGVRYSRIMLDADFTTKTFFPFPYDKIEQRQNAITGNLGFTVIPGDGWKIALNGSTGFRAPNVDDLAKVFESTAGGYVVVPNPDLKPENIYTGELTLSKIFENRISVEGNAYYSILKDVGVLDDFTLNGEDSIDYDGELTKVVALQNKNEGYIYGYNININADITSWFTMYARTTFTYGRVKTDSTDYPLDHIPPVFGSYGVKLNFNRFKGEFYVMYNGWKQLYDYNLVGEDNLQYATPIGMPAWYTLNLRASYQVHKYAQVQVGIENILDSRYRLFASNISAPGRNFVATLRFNY